LVLLLLHGCRVCLICPREYNINVPIPADDLLSDRQRKYIKHPRDWSGIAHMLSVEPDTVKGVLPFLRSIVLSPTPEDIENPSYWWVLGRVLNYLEDLKPVVDIYLRFVPKNPIALQAYFSTLGLLLPVLSRRDFLTFYERFKDRPAFWYEFSWRIARRGTRLAYQLILENLENPAFRPYLWDAVSRYVSRNGFRSPELLVALSRYADDIHYWRVLKDYLRRHPAFAPYILLRIPIRNNQYVFTALSLAKHFPRHLYPVIRELVRSGLRSKEFLAGLDSLKRKYPHIYGEI